MKILIVHNIYRLRGGEESVVSLETDSLRKSGHEVVEYFANSANILTVWDKLTVLFGIIYSFKQKKNLAKQIEIHEPDIVHVHNFLPCFSASIFAACRDEQVPVVHTLHNFRSICPTGYLMWDGQITERSIYSGSWWCIPKKVYQNSLLATISLTLSIEFHKRWGTWTQNVDGFIALTEFSREKFVTAGWPSNKIFVKPNFVSNTKMSSAYKTSSASENYALYVGRLSDEKGIDFIINSWDSIDYPLVVIGDGPMKALVERSENENIIFLGQKNQKRVLEYMISARCLVMASNWYEGFPMVLVEALSCSLPSIVPALGNMKSIVSGHDAGICYRAGDTGSFIESISLLFENDTVYQSLSRNAKFAFEENYTEDQNMASLTNIYTEITKTHLS